MKCLKIKFFRRTSRSSGKTRQLSCYKHMHARSLRWELHRWFFMSRIGKVLSERMWTHLPATIFNDSPTEARLTLLWTLFSFGVCNSISMFLKKRISKPTKICWLNNKRHDRIDFSHPKVFKSIFLVVDVKARKLK